MWSRVIRGILALALLVAVVSPYLNFPDGVRFPVAHAQGNVNIVDPSTSGIPGSVILDLHGTGFNHSGTFTITFTDTGGNVSQLTPQPNNSIDASGVFDVSVTLPAHATAGNGTITVTDN